MTVEVKQFKVIKSFASFEVGMVFEREDSTELFRLRCTESGNKRILLNLEDYKLGVKAGIFKADDKFSHYDVFITKGEYHSAISTLKSILERPDMFNLTPKAESALSDLLFRLNNSKGGNAVG